MYIRTFRYLIRLLALLLLVVGLAACGGTGSSGPTGTYTINTSGSTGGNNGATGGDGGAVSIEKYGGTGPIEILKTGSVDASFTRTATAANLGARGVIVSTDTTVILDPTIPPPVNDLYLVTGNTNLFVSNGVSGDVVTGIQIDTGVTLTFLMNAVGGTVSQMVFANDVYNRGTVTVADVSATQRGGLDIESAAYIGDSGATVTTAGILPGQHGGSLTLMAVLGFYNQGTIDASGADNGAGAGGNGGSISVTSQLDLENSGAISSSGGLGTGGAGGGGGFTVAQTWNGYLHNSAAITTTGGSGDSGGAGGDISLMTGFDQVRLLNAGAGAIRNGGNLSLGGGDGSAGIGGDAGSLTIFKLGGDLRLDADITATGGTTTNAASNAGSGGGLFIYSLPGVDSNDFTTATGDLLLTGNIRTTGSTAVSTGTGNGGGGGQIRIVQDASGSILRGFSWASHVFPSGTANPRLALLDFQSINSSGGDANSGGIGGNVFVVDNGEVWDGVSAFIDDSSGDVTNEVAITARGGSAVATAVTVPAMGGAGGTVKITADTDSTATNPAAETVTNSGSIDSSGGNSLAQTILPSRNAGGVFLAAEYAVTNSGSITANGGSDLVDDNSLATGYGHASSEVNLASIQASVTNSGTINANGGNGEATAGSGAQGGISGFIGILISAPGGSLTNSGNINARGGNADVTLTGSQGGDGGIVVYIYSTKTDTGTVDVSGGNGDTTGTAGSFTP